MSAAVLLSLLTACAVGPRYSRPGAPTPPAYKEESPNWKQAQPADQALRGKWWEVFQDGQLNALEEQVSVSNQTLKAATAQFDQARALARYRKADYYPTVTAGLSGSRTHQSENRPLSGLTRNYTDVVLPVDLSYEVDVWGRVRHTVEAARAEAQATAGDLEAVRLSLHAELALDYFELRSFDAEQQLLDSTVTAFSKALDLTQNRYKGGIASAVDVAQAQTQLETTRAQAIDVRIQRAQFEHAIAVLIGQPPSTFSLPVLPLTTPPPAIPPGLPSELLERRPDIAAAERRMLAANALVGVARTAYFPTLNLNLSGGFESNTFTNLLSGPSGFVTGAIAATVTAFDAGRRRAANDSARAAYDQTVATYRETVLGAFQEVEDNLSAMRVLEEEAQTQEAAVAAAQHSLDLSSNRYKGGVVSYLEVITAQNAALSDQRAAVDILRRRMAASVLLIKALGGGWDASSLPSATLDSHASTTRGD